MGNDINFFYDIKDHGFLLMTKLCLNQWFSCWCIGCKNESW